jgi:D-alanine-D-alanine ligase
MKSKKNIALVAGGYSAEYEVSIKSAQNIYAAIDDATYNKYLVLITKDKWEVHYNNETYPVDKNDFSFSPMGVKIKFDFAYVTIHGTPGENGVLQGYFAMLDIPHSTCDILAASLTFDKYTCNHYIKNFGINIGESILLRTKNQHSIEDIHSLVGVPCFVKPNADGSSFGISKVKTKEELKDALDKAFSYSNEVIVEKAINGLEFTCGAVKTSSKEIILPVTEIITNNEFFDFEAKYDPTKAEEITPARISDELTKELQRQTSHIYDILKLKGIIRVDFIIENNKIFVLEVNTTPGMTSNSFIPKQITADGRELKDIISLIIEEYSK